MNANQLFKTLMRAEGSFDNLEAYKNILSQSARLMVDFTGFKDLNLLIAKSLELAKERGLELPVDNVLLDIAGADTLDPVHGKPTKQPLTLHVIPVEVATDISTFHLMLVQDMRQVKNDVFPRSHAVFLGKEIAIMPAIDTGMPDLGCKCYQRNTFSHNPLFKKIQSFTPGFKADCGFAAAGCKSTLKPCQLVLNGSHIVVQVAIAAMVFATLPGHVLVEVTETTKPINDLKNMSTYIVCDSDSLDQLKKTGRQSPLKFNDFAMLDSLKEATFTPDKFSFGNISYEVITK